MTGAKEMSGYFSRVDKIKQNIYNRFIIFYMHCQFTITRP